MKNVVRFAAGAAALCWIFAFASCAQPTNKDSGGNNSGYQQGSGNNSGGNSSQQGNNSGTQQNGGNGSGSQQGGENQNTPKTYTVYLKNNSDYAVTFWYVKNVDNGSTYSSLARVEAGDTGSITGIPGGNTYKYNSKLENGAIRYSKPFYLDDDFVITIH